MMTTDHRLMLWTKDKYSKFFRYDKENKQVIAADDTLREAKVSFELWKKLNKLEY